MKTICQQWSKSASLQDWLRRFNIHHSERLKYVISMPIILHVLFGRSEMAGHLTEPEPQSDHTGSQRICNMLQLPPKIASSKYGSSCLGKTSEEFHFDNTSEIPHRVLYIPMLPLNLALRRTLNFPHIVVEGMESVSTKASSIL